jgi:hypothetical protein
LDHVHVIANSDFQHILWDRNQRPEFSIYAVLKVDMFCKMHILYANQNG